MYVQEEQIEVLKNVQMPRLKISSMKTLNLLVKMLCWRKRTLNRLHKDCKLTDFLVLVCKLPFSYNHTQSKAHIIQYCLHKCRNSIVRFLSVVEFYEPERHLMFWSVNYYQLIQYSCNFVKILMAFITIMLPIVIEKAIVASKLLLFIVRW